MNNNLATKQEVFSYLQEQSLGVIATISPESKPEAATVDYFIDDNWNMYILTHVRSRKITNIKSNQAVAMVIGTTPSTHTVQGEGLAEIILPTDKEYSDLLIHFAGMESLYLSPLFKIEGVNLVIIKITLTWLRWLERNKESWAESYTTILPQEN